MGHTDKRQACPIPPHPSPTHQFAAMLEQFAWALNCHQPPCANEVRFTTRCPRATRLISPESCFYTDLHATLIHIFIIFRQNGLSRAPRETVFTVSDTGQGE